MDGNILLWIQDHFRWEGMNWFWKGITSLGNGGWFWIVLCILMVVLAKISGEKCSIKNENCSRAVIGRAGWYGLLSMGAGALITNVCLKNLVARPRPYEVVEGLVPLIGKPTDYSFPSGHTCASLLCAGAVPDSTEKIRCTCSDPGITDRIFTPVCGCALSDRCAGRHVCRNLFFLSGSVERKEEDREIRKS